MNSENAGANKYLPNVMTRFSSILSKATCKVVMLRRHIWCLLSTQKASVNLSFYTFAKKLGIPKSKKIRIKKGYPV
jgi:hypothetical protein